MEVRATGSRVQLLVEDHGPGIPRQVRRAVFADATTDLTEAPRPHAGLGLHVAVALVRQQNGTIELTDRVGGGALFVITLPRAVGAPTGSVFPQQARPAAVVA